MTNKDIEDMKNKINELSEIAKRKSDESESLKAENKALKQRIKDLEDIGNNYEPQFAPDDDISAFNYECVKRWTTEMGCNGQQKWAVKEKYRNSKTNTNRIASKSISFM